MSVAWSGPSDIADKVRRRWKDETLLRAYGAGEPCPVIEVPLRGPRPSEIGDALDDVRAWVERLDTARRHDARYSLEWGTIGGRHFGRNRVPTRAVISSYEQAWALLRVTDDVGRLDAVLALSAGLEPVRRWVLAHPLKAIGLESEWALMVAAYAWLDEHRGSGRYLREISAPGVDTKFAERHRGTLAAMLGVGGGADGFLGGLGLRGVPELIRLRVAPGIGLPSPLTEVSVRADELAGWDLRPRSVLVLENQVSYLSVDVPDGGIVVWGRGFEIDRVGRLPWLAEADVRYWGDLDTHGFAILDRLRAWLPHARSILMDRSTLLAHRDRWGVEPKPASSRLTRLTPAEHDLYDDLVTDRLGDSVRLEQERVDWAWALEALSDSRAGG